MYLLQAGLRFKTDLLPDSTFFTHVGLHEQIGIPVFMQVKATGR